MSIFPWYKQRPENATLVHVSKTGEQKISPT